METHTYPTDLSYVEWQLRDPLLLPPAQTGRPQRHSLS